MPAGVRLFRLWRRGTGGDSSDGDESRVREVRYSCPVQKNGRASSKAGGGGVGGVCVAPAPSRRTCHTMPRMNQLELTGRSLAGESQTVKGGYHSAQTNDHKTTAFGCSVSVFLFLSLRLIVCLSVCLSGLLNSVSDCCFHPVEITTRSLHGSSFLGRSSVRASVRPTEWSRCHMQMLTAITRPRHIFLCLISSTRIQYGSILFFSRGAKLEKFENLKNKLRYKNRPRPTFLST